MFCTTYVHSDGKRLCKKSLQISQVSCSSCLPSIFSSFYFKFLRRRSRSSSNYVISLIIMVMMMITIINIKRHREEDINWDHWQGEWIISEILMGKVVRKCCFETESETACFEQKTTHSYLTIIGK